MPTKGSSWELLLWRLSLKHVTIKEANNDGWYFSS